MPIFRTNLSFLLITILLMLSGCKASPTAQETALEPGIFVAERAYEDVITQVSFGPRYPGSPGHEAVRAWLVDSLAEAGWQAAVLESSYKGVPIYNIEACREAQQTGGQEYVLLGAHYDTRRFADRDPDVFKRSQPVPGANDGGSGVAVLLELARALPEDLHERVCLVFFDAEDNGRIADWEWAVGSTAYAAQMTVLPRAVVIVDMVGDFDQQLPIEGNSDPTLAGEIWGVAASLGIESFLLEPGRSILDDHVPFIQLGIPAVDIIDIDYPFWHTVDDTSEKISAESLGNVGEVLLTWLVQANR